MFEDFKQPAYDEWLAAALASLKGRPFESVVSETAEGITLPPLQRREDIADLPHLDALPGQFPYVRGTRPGGYLTQPWLIAQRLPYPTPQQFNAALKADLQRGQTAVLLTPATRIETAADAATALDGIVFTAAPLFVHTGQHALPLLALLHTGLPQASLTGGLFNDPLFVLAGRGSAQLSQLYEESAQMIRWAADNASEFTTLAVNTAVYHHAGAHAAQELAFALATGVHHIRTLQAYDLSVSEIATQMRFIFAVGGDFFMEMAKLRAARLLWAQVVEAFGGGAAAQKMAIHAETAVRNKTRLDPYVNMLRTTTEAFAAAVGGVDSLATAPFDETFTTPDEFSRRIARNQQLILQEEANLIQLIDPAGGSYTVEWLTDQLAQRGWALFQEIESQGGMLAALQAGFPQKLAAETAVRRQQALARRKDVLVGVNMYANAGEQYSVFSEQYSVNDDQPPITRYPPLATFKEVVAEAQNGATLGQLVSALRQKAKSVAIEPVRPYPLAASFESLRERADAYARQHGHRPRIFLANMGSLRQHKARADFARGFFEVGGFEVVYPAGFDTPEAAAKAAVDAEVTAVVICSTDDTYPAAVPPLVRSLKTQQPDAVIILAGYPKEQIDAHKAAGVEAFIHTGADCLALNRWLQDKVIET